MYIRLIDWIEFYAVSAIFQPYNGGCTFHIKLNGTAEVCREKSLETLDLILNVMHVISHLNISSSIAPIGISFWIHTVIGCG